MRNPKASLFALGLASVLSLGLFAQAMADEATFSASEQGMGGQVTVTLTMDGDQITAVDIEGKDETPTIGGAAIETLIPAILEAQGADIEAVAGATITSDAVIKAVKKALDQAAGGGEAPGRDPEGTGRDLRDRGKEGRGIPRGVRRGRGAGGDRGPAVHYVGDLLCQTLRQRQQLPERGRGY